MHRKLLATAAVLALTSVFTAAPSANANHSWGGYHWARTANPFTVRLGDNVNGAWDSVLATTSGDWSRSAVLDATVVSGSTSPKKCSPKAGMVQVCNAPYGQRGWLGIASIWLSGGVHITQGTVKLNDTYFNMPQYDTTAWRNLVSCQEVGHTFGLDHQDENFSNTNLNTCMDYTNLPDSNQHPNQHDYDELAIIYSHLDSTNTLAASTPASSPDEVGNSPEAWGTLVDGSRERGGVSTYVRDLGNGNRVVTHVIWAQ